MGYSIHCLRAKEKPGRDVSLRTSIVKDQDKSICDTKNPYIAYQQGKKQVCLQYCLLSTITYLKNKTKSEKTPHHHLTLACIEKDLRKEIMGIAGKHLIATINALMSKNGWLVKRYNFKTKTRKEENENDLYKRLFDANEREGFHSILLLNLMDQYGLMNHFISICDNYIFDSNFVSALTLSENNLC